MYSPKYIITNKILKNIGAIEAAKEVIENAPLVPFYEKQFQSDAMVRTIHHGTHVEGNDLSLDQTKRILEGQDVYARERDIQEVINYRNVVTLLDELKDKRGGYEPFMLKEIHRETVNKIIPEEKRGNFRTTKVIIKEEGSNKIIFHPPSPEEIESLLEDFLSWLNSPEAKDLHPILKAGVAHYVLVTIHPFVEGNGRTTRAFSTLILLRDNYDIKRFFALEEHFDTDPASYYQAFYITDTQSPDITGGDLTNWLEYFTEVVAVELNKIKDRIRKISIDSKLKVKIGEQVALSERQMKLIEYLSENGSAGMQELKRLNPMISEDTILRDITNLMEKGIIKKEGKTKAARYVLAK